MLEQPEHLGLAGREVGVWRRLGLLDPLATWPNTPTMRSPFLSGTVQSSSITLVPSARKRTPSVSVTETDPMILRVKTSLARRVSSGATTEV
jgi:hypothetical protein